MSTPIYHFEVIETEALLELQASLLERLAAITDELNRRTGITEEMLDGR